MVMWMAPLEVMVGSAMSGTPLARIQVAHSSSSWVGLPLGRVVVDTEGGPAATAQAGHVRGAGAPAGGDTCRRQRGEHRQPAGSPVPPCHTRASLWLDHREAFYDERDKASVKARTFNRIL